MNEGFLNSIIQKLDKREVYITNHAKKKMVKHNINTLNMQNLIFNSELIEYYPDDDPCESGLLLGWFRNKPFHLVVGNCESETRIVTIYSPNPLKWINYKHRRVIKGE